MYLSVKDLLQQCISIVFFATFLMIAALHFHFLLKFHVIPVGSPFGILFSTPRPPFSIYSETYDCSALPDLFSNTKNYKYPLLKAPHLLFGI